MSSEEKGVTTSQAHQLEVSVSVISGKFAHNEVTVKSTGIPTTNTQDIKAELEQVCELALEHLASLEKSNPSVKGKEGP